MSKDNKLEQLEFMLNNFKVEYISKDKTIKTNTKLANSLIEINIEKYNKLCEDIDFDKLLLSDLDKSIKTFTELIKNIKIQNDLEKIFDDSDMSGNNTILCNRKISDKDIDDALFSE